MLVLTQLFFELVKFQTKKLSPMASLVNELQLVVLFLALFLLLEEMTTYHLVNLKCVMKYRP